MKIDFSQKILGPTGEDLNLTLGEVALKSLNSTPKNGSLSLSDALKRGNLALSVCNGGEHELDVEDVSLIRSLLVEVYTPIIVSRAAQMLDA